jgi:hypothetical protein
MSTKRQYYFPVNPLSLYSSNHFVEAEVIKLSEGDQWRRQLWALGHVPLNSILKTEAPN